MLGDVACHLVVSLAAVLQPLVLLYEPIMATEGREMTSLHTVQQFLSNLSVLRKRGSCDNEQQSHEEPGRETAEKPPAWMAGIFC